MFNLHPSFQGSKYKVQQPCFLAHIIEPRPLHALTMVAAREGLGTVPVHAANLGSIDVEWHQSIVFF